ncbi:MAG: bifunctional serine/threonine-protein kinase/formylglycine-generating enzyme family protein [Planctomycetota bacterium]
MPPPAEQPDRDPAQDLLGDPLLRDAPTLEGFKVLDPAVLYAKIGQGGMGAVYRGRHFKLDLDVAIKCLKPSLAAEDPDFVRRFEREARLAASIGHQNVVRVMDVQEHEGLHYLVMEFVRGETAAERVLRKGALAEREALAILFGAAAGLAEAHARGIVHRDVKPDNVMVSLEGRVKLADLGLARSQGAIDGRSRAPSSAMIMGTPQYMPPEQWESSDVTPAADVWALGATFFFLVTGRAGIPGNRPYHAIARRIHDHDYPDLRRERPDLRPEVHALFERCVQRDPARRFADARELLRELRRLVVEDEQALFDPETGTGCVRAGVVTPPPKQTLLRIRAQVEQLAAAGRDRPAARSAPVTPDEAPTRPSAPRRATVTEPVRLRWWSAMAVAAAVTSGLAIWLATSEAPDRDPARVAECSIAEPVDNALLASRVVLARGGVSGRHGAGLRVSLVPEAGESANARGVVVAASIVDGGWTATLVAERDGPYRLLVEPEALDERRAVAPVQRRLRLDTQAPVVRWLTPDPAASVPAGKVTVGGTAIDDDAVVQVLVDDRPAEFGGEQWQAEVFVPEGGSRTVAVVAVDAAGNRSEPLWRMLRADRGPAAPATAPVAAPPPTSSVDAWAEVLAARPDPAVVTGAEDRARLLATGLPWRVRDRGTGVVLLLVPPGAFDMGSPSDEPGRAPDEQLHRVVVERAFYCGQTEVDQHTWQRVMGDWPSASRLAVGPVEQVSHERARQFAERSGLRLLREAEWEYVCRAGGQGPFGRGIAVDTAVFNYDGDFVVPGGVAGLSRGRPVACGRLGRNAWGFADLHGNVAEWCADDELPYGRPGAAAGQAGDTRKVVRGGSYYDMPLNCRCAHRRGFAADTVSERIGLRVARDP